LVTGKLCSRSEMMLLLLLLLLIASSRQQVVSSLNTCRRISAARSRRQGSLLPWLQPRSGRGATPGRWNDRGRRHDADRPEQAAPSASCCHRIAWTGRGAGGPAGRCHLVHILLHVYRTRCGSHLARMTPSSST
jgi:hypothetical protein